MPFHNLELYTRRAVLRCGFLNVWSDDDVRRMFWNILRICVASNPGNETLLKNKSSFYNKSNLFLKGLNRMDFIYITQGG